VRLPLDKACLAAGRVLVAGCWPGCGWRSTPGMFGI